ncbi:MAG TPA: glycoside hydrolase family 16 protein [Ktedonobacteraceae bacterium]|jgi:beta-glucanase (GH16 family)|nr:glycoside hydrolase family 16 protein [Ktedonobacteraceae bacterium]
MRKLAESTFFCITLTFTVILVLTIPMRFGGQSLAKPITWTRVWGTEFDGPANSKVDPSYWRYDTGDGYGCSGCPANWGTGEIESMSNSTANVSRDGKGHLVIKAIRNSRGNWTSGRIETQRTNFAAPPGGQLKITASLQQPNAPNAAGYWPAFWIAGTPFRNNYLNWPQVGAITIMEDVNGLSSEFGTLHCGAGQKGPCNETTGLGSGKRPCSGCQNAFHTYMVIIDRSISPEQIRWYLDGANFFTVKADQVPVNVWHAAVDDHAFFIVFDLAIGGVLPAAEGGGPNSSTASGGSLQVDYVHVYVARGSSMPTPSPVKTPTKTIS